MNESTESTQKTRRRKHGCGLGCLVAFLVCCLGIAILVAAGIFMVASIEDSDLPGLRHLASSTPTLEGGLDENPRLREVWSMGDNGSDVKVARIPIRGAIMPGDSVWRGEGDGSAVSALRAIRRATWDKDVRAILLEIDSPGGGITMSDQIYHALNVFRMAGEGRVIVALMGDLCAAGGYYVALAADKIVAHPTTLTGSIGVLMSSVNVRELAERLGIRDVTIKSGENKDMLNPLRDLTPAQAAMLQQVIDAMHSRFVGLVALRRELPEEKVRELADGRVFLAEAAREAGLIDKVGYHELAVEQVHELLKIEEPLHFIRYAEEPSWIELFRRPRRFGTAELRQLLHGGDTRLLYQWAPR